jgi:CheY-like chemotaxis protein
MSIPYGPILVVEDIPNILDLLTVTLQFKGYPVVTATNGQEALAAIQQERPALIITDILMPKMDGYTLMQTLRTDLKTSQIPIIVLSATYVSPEDKSFALKLGAVRFMEKPIDTGDFLLTVAEVLLMGTGAMPPPISQREFYIGYRDRLEEKLSHKNAQIARTKCILETLPADQKAAFQVLLAETQQHRDAIQMELDNLFKLMEQYND